MTRWPSPVRSPRLRGVLAVDTVADTMRVLAGTRWREVEDALDPLGRAVKVMQAYNNFTVGGALSVTAHGRLHRT
jgi:FAD/FMN-containing dehydrogenase